MSYADSRTQLDGDRAAVDRRDALTGLEPPTTPGRLAAVALALRLVGIRPAGPNDLRGRARRAAQLAALQVFRREVKSGVRVAHDPRLKVVVDVLQEADVLDVVPLHVADRLRVARHELKPERETLVLDLAREAESLAHVLQLVAREPKLALDGLE